MNSARRLIILIGDHINLVMAAVQLFCAGIYLYRKDFGFLAMHLIFSAFFCWIQRQKQKTNERLEIEFQAIQVQLTNTLASQPEKKHSTCAGCKYYHGKHKIICAIHPSGFDGNFCVDKEVF